MENEKTYVTDKVVDELLDKKIRDYGSNEINFTIPHELTVTITLKEYRTLVESKALKEDEISKIRSEKYKLQEKINQLETENDLLTRKIMRMDKEAEGSESEVKA